MKKKKNIEEMAFLHFICREKADDLYTKKENERMFFHKWRSIKYMDKWIHFRPDEERFLMEVKNHRLIHYLLEMGISRQDIKDYLEIGDRDINIVRYCYRHTEALRANA